MRSYEQTFYEIVVNNFPCRCAKLPSLVALAREVIFLLFILNFQDMLRQFRQLLLIFII